MNSDDLIRWLINILLNLVQNAIFTMWCSDQAISIENLAKLISIKIIKKIKKITIYHQKIKQIIDYYVPSIAKAKRFKFEAKI